MKHARIILLTLSIVVMLVASPALAVPVDVNYENGPQDDLFVPPQVHELGIGFPQEEQIIATAQLDPRIPCPTDYIDDPDLPNYLVTMTNLTGQVWDEVWYVGDAQRLADGTIVPETMLTNDDGWVNGGLAFKIDSVGLNKPLVFESMIANDIFEPGETWQFLVQNYSNINGLLPSDFFSWLPPVMGLVGVDSGFDPISSASIIAIPEPATMTLLVIGGIGVLVRRRKRKVVIND